jgi:hypothetical protein
LISGWCVEGARIVEICQKGDQMFEEELAKVYKGKKIHKGRLFHSFCDHCQLFGY